MHFVFINALSLGELRERKIKLHVQRTHLPKIFNNVKPLKSLDDESLHKIQVRLLESLVRYVFGADADLWEAVAS